MDYVTKCEIKYCTLWYSVNFPYYLLSREKVLKIFAGFMKARIFKIQPAPTPHPQCPSPHPHRTRRQFLISSPHPHRTRRVFNAGYRDRPAVAGNRKPARGGLARAGLWYLLGQMPLFTIWWLLTLLLSKLNSSYYYFSGQWVVGTKSEKVVKPVIWILNISLMDIRRSADRSYRLVWPRVFTTFGNILNYQYLWTY